MAILNDPVSSDKFCDHDLEVTQSKRDLLAGMLYQMKAECNFLQIGSRVKSCETKRYVRQLSNRQRVVENARGRSSRLLRFCSMSGKISDGFVRNQAYGKMETSTTRTPQRELMDNKFNSYSTWFLVPRRKIGEWIRQGQGEDGQHFTPETYPHRVKFTGMMSEIPFSTRTGRRKIL